MQRRLLHCGQIIHYFHPLKNIVGRDFLPRGTGIVTRRPLVLQLIHRPATPPQPNGLSCTFQNETRAFFDLKNYLSKHNSQAQTSKPTKRNGENSCISLARNSMTSTKFVQRSSVTQRQKQAVTLVFPHSPSTYAYSRPTC